MTNKEFLLNKHTSGHISIASFIDRCVECNIIYTYENLHYEELEEIIKEVEEFDF